MRTGVTPAPVEGDRLVDEPGCAEPELQRVAGDEGALHWVQPAHRSVALDGDHLAAIEPLCREEAAHHGLAIHEDRAGAAHSAAAHELGPGQRGGVADDVDGRTSGRRVELDRVAIQTGSQRGDSLFLLFGSTVVASAAVILAVRASER